jgi:hypothetical protein
LDTLAYAGQVKTVIWAADASGRRHGQEYFDDLPDKERAKIEALLHWMGDRGEIRNKEKFRPEGDGVFCFKSGLHRLPCFFDGKNVVITHGFHKRHPKMPSEERVRAVRIRAVYVMRGGRQNATS